MHYAPLEPQAGHPAHAVLMQQREAGLQRKALLKLVVLTGLATIMMTTATSTHSWYYLEDTLLTTTRAQLGPFGTNFYQNIGVDRTCTFEPFSCTLKSCHGRMPAANSTINVGDSPLTTGGPVFFGSVCGRLQAVQGLAIGATTFAWLTAVAYLLALVRFNAAEAQARQVAGVAGLLSAAALFLVLATSVAWPVFISKSDLDDASADTAFYSWSCWLVWITVIVQFIGALFHRKASRQLPAGAVPPGYVHHQGAYAPPQQQQYAPMQHPYPQQPQYAPQQQPQYAPPQQPPPQQQPYAQPQYAK